MRKLVAENPIEMLMHHVQILDRVFMIFSIEYEGYQYSNEAGADLDSNKIM